MHVLYGGMEERNAGGRNVNRREIMLRVRAQALLVRRIGEQIKEICPDGVRSLRPGTGGGRSGTARGLDARIERMDALERMLEREAAKLHEYEEAARREMEGMRPTAYAFCMMYFIGGHSMQETSAMIERSMRQCERYRSEIESCRAGEAERP